MIEFEGIDEIIREFEKIEQMIPGSKDEALIAGGDILRDRMKQEVYRNGLQEQSGEGRESIIRTNPSNDELYVGTQGGAKQPGFYLYMHEFGYFNVRAGRFIPPKPFASIAFEGSISEILGAQAEVLRKKMGL
ncbi:hypothetical protein JMA_22190 [Jeotgalibacillus malaysiensis]|uniref:HK97 gp10 family phage protein n=1 Tax=Jeotgalibacillus malaysiensis TaxID=1508404 RepID=A0A0B5AN19_9BACL|nr:hypothetical protein [Jeotgalibacillus malaysiensis]AJD91536.1 hypothetical protein JMA_22190 [Jeotgalibacillus malaysiensis]